jgi:Fic family protein
MQSTAKKSQRAGRYEPQTGGWMAFIPKVLPPEPPLKIGDNLLSLLSAADRAIAGLDSAIQTLPSADRFVFSYVRAEAVLSSQIEGTQSSLDDLFKAEARVTDRSIPDDVNEVSNYVAAMNLGLSSLNKIPVSARLIRMIHERLMRGVRGDKKKPGEFRNDRVWIGVGNSKIEEAIYIPPPFSQIESHIAQFEKFLHNKDKLHPLIKIGLAHAQFESIHPFHDGNGRVGRLLITLLLCEKGMLNKPVLYLSHYLRAHRQEYYDRLQAIRDEGQWEEWLEFFLQGVSEVGAQAIELARKIVLLREEHRTLIVDKFAAKAAKAIKIIEYLYQKPYTDVQHVASLLNVSYANANNIISLMVKEKLLEEMTGNARNRVFFYSPYLKLLRVTQRQI